MDKALDILETNVQWIVLGIAGLFLLWVAYGFVITPPAAVKVGNRTDVLPGEIAGITYNGPAIKLKNEIETGRAEFTTPDLVSAWQSHMGQPLADPVGALAFNAGPGADMIGTTINTSSGVHIAALPKLPEPEFAKSVTGMSVVQVTPPQTGSGTSGRPNPNQTVAQPAGKDMEWVTVSAVIPGEKLGKAMLAPLKGQPVDPALYNTQLLQVTLERQTSNGVDANGQPVFPEGDQNIEQVRQVTVELTPMPSDNSPVDAKYKFLEWAQHNTDLIARPAFYAVTAGTPWTPPEMPAVVPAGDNGAAPATAPATAPAAPAPAPAAPAPGTPAARADFNSTTIPLPSHAQAYQQYDRRRPSYGPPGTAGDPRNPSFRPPVYPGNFNIPNNPGFNGTNSGAVNPFVAQADIQIWAHDLNVKPGQTYRYRLSYQMKNPVFDVNNLADPKLVHQFAIASPPSEWTEPVTVPETTKFWVSSIGREAKVDVFQWVKGDWTTKNLVVAPGDAIPGTDLTVVDVRTNDVHQRDHYLLLTHDSGKLEQRNPTEDANNAEYQAMKAPPANGGAPGVPNGVTPPPSVLPPNLTRPRGPTRTPTAVPPTRGR